jgi:hypothetical protein
MSEMVVILRDFAVQSAARRIVGSVGVPESVLDATEQAHANVDWRELAVAFDDVFLSRGGGMGQAWFLRERHPELRGMTPLEALPTSNGPSLVRRAALAFARRAHATC